ncbi:ComEA family DNA-binding protein [Candidatus Roizmanbacteria bacterium]|nr:ComEA family DNA-binding protein [Candidatus Roizmanbacteria bacterium]
MRGLIISLKPLWDKYKMKTFLVSTAFVIAIVSLFIFLANQTWQKEEIPILSPVKTTPLSENRIVVDLSGSIEKPDVYETSSGARLKDVMILAGGLSAQADRKYFSRNFNLAKILKDQEKIYIPSIDEIEDGILKQNTQIITNNQDQIIGVSSDFKGASRININTASMSELDSLAGIGKVTAQKIIQNRPYQSIEDLLNKKVVGKSLFEKIKEQIEL